MLEECPKASTVNLKAYFKQSIQCLFHYYAKKQYFTHHERARFDAKIKMPTRFIHAFETLL